MGKRYLNCTASDILKMDSAQLIDAIAGSEGRLLVCETIGAVRPMLGDVTNAEFACAMGADLLILNLFDVNKPEVQGLPETAPEDVVREVKWLTGRAVGINLEPLEDDVESSVETNGEWHLTSGRAATVENARKAIDMGVDFIVLTGNPGVGVLSAIAGGAVSFLTSLPAVLTMLVVLVASTYFFSRDGDALRAGLRSLLSERGEACLREAGRHGASLGGRWIASYLLLCALTALETLLLFLLLGLPYPLLLSLLAGLADLLPVLGPGLVYLPAALVAALLGNWPACCALLLGWLLIGAVRQIVEPKLVSSLVRVHPLVLLAALYGSLVAQSLWLLVYFLLFFLAARGFPPPSSPAAPPPHSPAPSSPAP